MHAVNKAGEELGLVSTEIGMLSVQAFQADAEFDITGTHDVLNLEVLELYCWVSDLLDHFGIHACSCFRLFLTFGTSNDHLARTENEGCGLRITNSDDDSCETFGIVFGISAIESDFSQVKLCSEICRGNDVLKLRGGALHRWGS